MTMRKRKNTLRQPKGKSKFVPVILGATLVISSPVFAEWATVGLGTIMGEMSTQIPKHASDQAKDIQKVSQSTRRKLDDSTENIVAALKVAVKQKAQAANQITDASTKNTQTIASGIQALLQSDTMKKAQFAYGANTGQGFKSCEVLAENTNMSSASGQVIDQAADMATQTSQVGGKLVGSQQEVINQRLNVHKAEFCTVAEAQAGQCTLSKLPGGDTNASLLFKSVAPNSKEALARHYVRENILGTPDKSLSNATARTPAGQDYLQATNQKTALLAMPAYSLAVIDAQNTKSFKDIDGKMVSANDLIDQTIARYYGGPEAKKWQMAMAMQDPRGLLKEANIINGVSVYLDLQTYKQSLREEGLLSALLLAKSQPIKDDVKTKYGQSVKVKLSQTMPQF